MVPCRAGGQEDAGNVVGKGGRIEGFLLSV